MKFQIVTNNPKVIRSYKGHYPLHVVEGSFRGVMEELERLTYEGYIILSHPLSGSVKPHETPYKSVLVSALPQPTIDKDSCKLIQQALITTDKFGTVLPHWSDEILKDFQTIDHTLIESALQSAVYDNT